MTTPRRLERDLPALLADLYLAGTPDYRDDLVRTIARTPQRAAWTFPERWLPMDIATERVPTARFPMRALGILALIGILIAASVAIYVGAQPRLPEPFGPAATGLHVYTRHGDVITRDGIDGPERILFPGEAAVLRFAPSPDGTQLLSVQVIDGGVGLFVSSIDGSDRIMVAGPLGDLGRIEWSPDGSTIAVAHGEPDASAILLVAADGSGTRPLDVGMPADEPTWRPPDGRMLAFRGKADMSWSLFITDADGSTAPRLLDVERALLNAPYEVLGPVWSPSGDRIAYHRLVMTPGQGSDGAGFRIAVASVDAGGALLGDLTLELDAESDDEYFPHWMPDGSAIVYLVREADRDSLAMAAPEAGATVTRFGVTSAGTDARNLWPSVTPDGREIIVHDYATSSDYLIDVATSDVTPLDGNTDDGFAFQRRAE